MIRRIATFDPTTGSTIEESSNFPNTLPNNQGYLLVWNDSAINLIFEYGNDQQTIVAGTFDVIKVKQTAALIYWWQDFVLSNAGQAPISRVTIDGATWDERDIIESKTYPISLPRVQNVGNQVSTTSSQSIINDGNTAGTQVIEATPSGGSGSNMKLDNQGTGVLGKGNLLINGTQLTAQNGYTIDPTVLGSGALPAGVTLAATQLTSGAVPAGVTVPATQITSGALPAGVTVPAAQVTSGFLPTSVEIGTANNNKFSMQNFDGWGGAVGIYTIGNNIWFASDHNSGFLYNCYYDGTNYRFINGNGDYAIQILISKDAQGGTLARWNARYSTTTAGSTGATITWGNWFCFAQMVDTNGNTPTHIYTGTTTPSGQNVGDLWFDW